MQDNSDIYRERIELARRYIERHMHCAVTLQDIAQAAHFSAFHFHRLFTALTGETPANCLNRIRLEQAAHRLLYRADDDLTDIALRCGFQSSSRFSRAFKQHYGQTPSAWRREQSKNRQAATFPNGDDRRNDGLRACDAKFAVDVQRLPALEMGYLSTGDGYDGERIARLWRTVLAWAGPAGLLTPQTRYVSVALDDPDITRAYRCRYFAGISVEPDSILTNGRVGRMPLHGGTYAVLHYHGPVAEIDAAYRYLYRDWLPASGYQPADAPVYEVLLTLGPDETGTIHSEIRLPIVKLK